MLCIASEYFPVGLSPIDNRTGICWNITTGIHLDILYAETGKSNGYPIYEILGAKVRYVHIEGLVFIVHIWAPGWQKGTYNILQ